MQCSLPPPCYCVVLTLPLSQQQLKQKHAEAVARNVALQADVERIPALRKQLESYKDAKADAVGLQFFCALATIVVDVLSFPRSQSAWT
jgi:hypothetical protein